MFKWPPPRRHSSIAVVVPSSNLSLYRDWRLKTRLAGEYVRALAVFRVSAVGIFRDPDASEEDHRLFLKVSRYMLIPPYLRVKVEPLDRDLRFAGLLPPLTIYPHNPESRRPSVGDVRYGLVLNEYGQVDIGWKRPCRLADAGRARPGEVMLVEVESSDPLVCRDVIDPPIYAGYRVVDLSGPAKLKDFLGGCGLVVNTSKTGRCALENRETLESMLRAKSICLLFGNPRRDFDELIDGDVRIDVTLNFVPNQGTLTVRTHEALISSLAILNALLESRHAGP